MMANSLNGYQFYISTFLIVCFLVLGSFQTVEAQIQDCPLTITKSADPADNTPFVIFLGGNSIIPQITLQDPIDPTNQINVPSETAGVTLKEDVPPGWALVDISCQGEPGFSFNILDDDTVVASCLVLGNAPPSGSCTFRNVRVASAVPTISQWGMVAFAGILGIIGLVVYRRRLIAE